MKSEKIEGNKTQETLIKHYENENIKFKVFTWKQLIDELSNATCNDTLCKFLVESLKNCYKKNITADILECKEFSENYDTIKTCLQQAQALLVNNKIADNAKPIHSNVLGYYCPALDSLDFGRCYFGAAPKLLQRYKEEDIELPHFYFFIIENADGNDERFRILNDDILQEVCHFRKIPNVLSRTKNNMAYVAPLDFSIDSSEMMSKVIAVSVAKIINKLNIVYLRKKNELEIEQKSKEYEAALRAL